MTYLSYDQTGRKNERMEEEWKAERGKYKKNKSIFKKLRGFLLKALRL